MKALVITSGEDLSLARQLEYAGAEVAVCAPRAGWRYEGILKRRCDARDDVAKTVKEWADRVIFNGNPTWGELGWEPVERSKTNHPWVWLAGLVREGQLAFGASGLCAWKSQDRRSAIAALGGEPTHVEVEGSPADVQKHFAAHPAPSRQFCVGPYVVMGSDSDPVLRRIVASHPGSVFSVRERRSGAVTVSESVWWDGSQFSHLRAGVDGVWGGVSWSRRRTSLKWDSLRHALVKHMYRGPITVYHSIVPNQQATLIDDIEFWIPEDPISTHALLRSGRLAAFYDQGASACGQEDGYSAWLRARRVPGHSLMLPLDIPDIVDWWVRDIRAAVDAVEYGQEIGARISRESDLNSAVFMARAYSQSILGCYAWDRLDWAKGVIQWAPQLR